MPITITNPAAQPAVTFDKLQISRFSLTVDQTAPYTVRVDLDAVPYGESGGERVYQPAAARRIAIKDLGTKMAELAGKLSAEDFAALQASYDNMQRGFADLAKHGGGLDVGFTA